jgi:hypothetical protein
LLLKHRFSFFHIIIAKVLGKDSLDIICDGSNAFSSCKLIVIEQMVKQILVHDVIFNLKGVFRKFLKDFLRRYLVNDCISVEPFDLSVYFLKSSFPISGFAKFVLVFIEIGVLFVDIQFNDNSVVVTSFLFKFDLEFLLAKLFHIFFGPRDDS